MTKAEKAKRRRVAVEIGNLTLEVERLVSVIEMMKRREGFLLKVLSSSKSHRVKAEADRAALVAVLDRIASYGGNDPAASLCRSWAKNAIAKHWGQS